MAKTIRLTAKLAQTFKSDEPAGKRYRSRIATKAESLAADGASVQVLGPDDELLDYHMGANEMRDVARA